MWRHTFSSYSGWYKVPAAVLWGTHLIRKASAKANKQTNKQTRRKLKPHYRYTLSFILWWKTSCWFVFYSLLGIPRAHAAWVAAKRTEIHRAASSHPSTSFLKVPLNTHYFDQLINSSIWEYSLLCQILRSMRCPSVYDKASPCPCTQWQLKFPYGRHIDTIIRCRLYPYSH